jgi:hypothetical protein
MPLLAAIGAAATIFVSAVVFGGSPPPQPPFPYPEPFANVGTSGVTNVPDPRGCGIAETQLPLGRPTSPDLLPEAWLGYAPWTGPTLKRARIFLARRQSDMQRWLYLVRVTDAGYGVGRQLASVDFRRCAIVAVFLPGNFDAGVLGARLNDETTLTLGLYRTPHPTGRICGTTGGTTTTGGVGVPTTGSLCSDSPPIDGSELFFALDAKTVAQVSHIYAITQAPPPPPPLGSTTG